MQGSGNDKSSIGKNVVVQGELSGAEDVVFAGAIKGTISLPQSRFTLDAAGRADANITAKEVVIAGALRGNIDGATRVQIRGTGSVHGAIHCQHISVEEGAIISGKVDMGGTTAKGEQKEQIALQMSVS